MGKAKKLKLGRRPPKVALDEQIESDQFAKPSTRVKVKDRKDEDEEYVDAKLSRKILLQARQQQSELEEEFPTYPKKAPTTSLGGKSESSDESEPDDVSVSEYGNVEIDAEDERDFSRFLKRGDAPQRTLADIIAEALAEKRTELQTEFSEVGGVQLDDLDPRLKEMYEGVRDVLSKYRSGKLPKAFKIIPHLRNWEQILYVTDPTQWSAAAMYQATRIFASNFREKMAQRFYNLVLLPRIRDDIMEYKRLNFHLYQALRKALFKPGAFMKGILLPLCESGTCSLREAIILGSVIARNSIPILHSSAAILKISEMDYNGANSIFLRILFDKKYALPYRVVDAIVFHFLRFERDRRNLPVLWHQALLTFVQRYKADISSEQREALLTLLRRKNHPTITPEIRRELQHAKCRDEEVAEPMVQD